MSKLPFLLVFCIHAQTTIVYTPREIEVTPWPETTSTTKTWANDDLFGVAGWGLVRFKIK